ncbi:MAG TPA: translation elongation factor Ts [Candidatus Dormibacteraeota bacterium]|nr:translation elongation factor Ts [Candidatus Dormibacteraeota bacterium]
MAVDMDLVKKLREMSGAGMMDCKNALEEAGGDLDKAFTILREKGIAKAAKRADRMTGQGVVESYLHSTMKGYPPQLGVLIEVNCETDFVAKTDDFRNLAKELAIQVGAFGAQWVSRQDVPDEVLVKEREVYEAKALQDGKPEKIIPRIVESQVEDFLKHNVLLEQEYFREPGRTVQQLVAEYISKLQENITVRRFARFNIREG